MHGQHVRRKCIHPGQRRTLARCRRRPKMRGAISQPCCSICRRSQLQSILDGWELSLLPKPQAPDKVPRRGLTRAAESSLTFFSMISASIGAGGLCAQGSARQAGAAPRPAAMQRRAVPCGPLQREPASLVAAAGPVPPPLPAAAAQPARRVAARAAAAEAAGAAVDPSTLKAYLRVQNGSDVRGVALDSNPAEPVTLTPRCV